MTVGFFGKVPGLGDFISRRLPHEMLLQLDAWIQAALVQSKLDLGANWLPTWLNSPLWRFVLARDLCGAQAWAGVMMPSADRVGRCFPLILAARLQAAPDARMPDPAWFARLEALALGALEDGFSFSRFDAALCALEGASGATRGLAMACTVFVPHGVALPSLAEGVARGCSAWWTEGSALVAPSLAICPGLPAPASVTAFLDGRWQEHGWQPVAP
ncbi:type VI secretion system-associated protein TagF [Massilia sp. S19_KUP03_FR1]|uniref:type VI secretion system-associated protein TagF n=1 Tax=Massilia sp. S19_KUP03_FR1 TaxID=3025503 RepID=UPI002FCDAA48